MFKKLLLGENISYLAPVTSLLCSVVGAMTLCWDCVFSHLLHTLPWATPAAGIRLYNQQRQQMYVRDVSHLLSTVLTLFPEEGHST